MFLTRRHFPPGFSATSALDTNSERQVQDALVHIRSQKQMTTISVAHRLSTIVHCDQIAVISGGCIAELGSHQQLFQLGGIYTSLCESQGITTESTFESKELIAKADDLDVELTLRKDKPDLEQGLLESELVDDEEEMNHDIFASPWRILALNKSEIGYLIMGVLGAVTVGALAPSEAILTARIVENFYIVEADQLVATNRNEILYFLILGAASLVGNILSGIGFSVSGYRLSGRMRSLVFEAIVRRNLGWFDVPEHSVGELTTRLEADAEEVAKITGWALGYKIRMFSSLAAGVIIAMIFSWQVGLTALLCIPIIMASSMVQRYCVVRQAAAPEGLSPEAIFENGLRGIDAVQSYGLQGVVSDNYSLALVPQSARHVTVGVTSGLVFGLSQFAVFGSFAIIFFVGTDLLVNQKVSFIVSVQQCVP
jgi:ATP-binding cassette, subfamily B (MDR/TAP), member 1